MDRETLSPQKHVTTRPESWYSTAMASSWAGRCGSVNRISFPCIEACFLARILSQTVWYVKWRNQTFISIVREKGKL